MARIGENIYKRKDGRYEGRYVTGRKDGRTKFGYVYGWRYGDVRARLIEKKAETQRQGLLTVPGCKETLEIWMNEWMEGELRGSVKPSSYQTYLNQWNRHILPRLGKTALAQITPSIVMEFIASLWESGLSEGTVRGIHRLLSSGLRAALEEGRIRQNPCKKVRIQRGERKEQRVLSCDEQKEVEGALSEEDMPALLSLYTGMRLGEVCALKWSDINWLQGTVTVRRTVQRLRRTHAHMGGRTELVIGSPKSFSSHRVIPVPPFVLARLRAYQKIHSGQPNGFVFGTTVRAADPRAIQRRFERVTKNLNLDGVHFHTLRHSFATRMLELGVDAKTLSLLLGHASTKTTLDCYAHSLMDRRRSAMSRLDDFYLCANF